MKRLSVVFFFMMVTSAYTQTTTVQVFYENGIHWGDPNVYANDSVFVENSGRIIGRNLELPSFDTSVNITASLEVIPNDNGTPCTGDPWDKAGYVILTRDDMPEMPPVELVKFITGFGGHTFHDQDVTLLASLLQGPVTIRAHIDTYVDAGWFVNFHLTYEQTNELPFNWSTGLYFNQGLSRPQVSATEPSVMVDIPAGMSWFNLAYFTSGHSHVGSGGDEFITKANVIYVDGVEIYRFSPWRDDCGDFGGVNPCSGPGSYTFSRSGWCPGDEVAPVVLDLSGALSPGEHEIRYSIEGITPNQGYWRVSSYLAGLQFDFTVFPTQIELTGPDELFQAVDEPFLIELALRNDEGHWVYEVDESIRLTADSPNVMMRTAYSDWANPLEIDVAHGKTAVWVQSSQQGSFSISAEDMDTGSPLAPPDGPIFLQTLTNLSPNGMADADCSCNNDTETPDKAIDGNRATKWCCNDALPHWLTVTVPDTAQINYFVIRHAGEREAIEWNTTAFQIQIHDNGQWTTVVDVTDNPGTEEGNVTYHSLDSPVQTDQVRLYITDPGADQAARIYEVEIYSNPDLLSIETPQTDGNQNRFWVSPNYPNPFNGHTTVQFMLPTPGHVTGTVYNAAGEVVRRLVNEALPAGEHSLSWDGRTERGVDAASGMYFLRVDYQHATDTLVDRTTRMVYLK